VFGPVGGSQRLALPTPTVSVIIPARDAAPTLDRALEGLRAQDLKQPFETIVVDDGSADETAAIARRHEPSVHVIRNERSQGPGGARNVGARAARASVLAFTDADCFPTAQWLSRGLTALKAADLVQGAVMVDPRDVHSPFDRKLVVERDSGLYETANLLVRREIFEAVGGFRDWALETPGRRRWSRDRRRGRATRTPIGEDTLFAWNARRLGARVAFAPEVLVHHEVVPGGVLDDVADRWHWARDMPGLARLIPELRETAFFGRWFFNERTARFDAAAAGLLLAVLTHRRLPLAASYPYLRWLVREARPWGLRRGSRFVAGAPIIDAVTFAGLINGSVAWRCPVL